MTIREQLEKEMEQEKIKETEEENADSKEYVEMDNSDTNNCSNADWSYTNQRTLDSGGNIAFPFLMAILLWYVPRRAKEFIGSCK